MMSHPWRDGVYQSCDPQLTSCPVSSTHSLAHCFLASISTLNMVQTDSGTLKSVDLLAFCILESNADFVLWDKKKKKVFTPEIWVLGASQVRNESHLCLLRSLITGGAYLWVFTGLYSVFVALKGLPVVGVRHKNKDKDRARWIQTDVEVLIQLWWPLSLTSWRRPPSCRWPSIWVSAPDVWRTRAPASGGPARTSAEHPASRTNPRRWPSRYCREDEERD